MCILAIECINLNIFTLVPRQRIKHLIYNVLDMNRHPGSRRKHTQPPNLLHHTPIRAIFQLIPTCSVRVNRELHVRDKSPELHGAERRLECAEIVAVPIRRIECGEFVEQGFCAHLEGIVSEAGLGSFVKACDAQEAGVPDVFMDEWEGEVEPDYVADFRGGSW